MTPVSKLNCAGRTLDLTRTAIMGILNVTPDSFSDGGQHHGHDVAIRHAVQMVEDGADIIDIGGESTRPGAQPVSAQQQLDRIAPVIEAVYRETDVPISLDTSSPAVMTAGIAAGGGLINDIRALGEAGAIATAADHGVPVCLMHMQGTPQTMQDAPRYDDTVRDILDWLSARVDACVTGGIRRERILIDPGFGFGKSLAHNLELLDGLDRFGSLGLPVLAGMSRKGMISQLLGLKVNERAHASVALALLAHQRGAAIVRVHDVRETRDVIRMCEAVNVENRDAVLHRVATG